MTAEVAAAEVEATAAEAAVAERYVRALDIRPSRVAENVGNLSGGNQQKVLLSKWLATTPDRSSSPRLSIHRAHAR